MRLASYNIRKCIGLDRRRDPARILKVINGIEADVVALQEADRRLGARPAALPREMVEAETDFVPVELDAAGVSLGFHGNAMLVRKGLPVRRVARLELPGTEPRGAIAVEIDAAIRVVGVHLGLLRSDRRRQLAVIEARVDDALPTAILGDFNEWRARAGLEALHHGFSVHAPGRSFHAARPVAALDRVALSRHLALRDAGVVQDRPARIASDHLPIWADVAGLG
ncbi:MAG: endonuclease/exonuclease/phosphatase family protein [Rhodobacter sp.]|nr:endonuclease/exonuclease/phosphatase family protein [Rhodobacter sp.]